MKVTAKKRTSRKSDTFELVEHCNTSSPIDLKGNGQWLNRPDINLHNT